MRLLRAVLIVSFLLSFGPNRIAGETARPAGSTPASAASWSYAQMGSGIGLAGLVLGHLDGTTREIYASGSSTEFGQPDFWYVLRYSASSQAYEQVFASEPLPSRMVRIATADLYGDGRQQIVVALQSGEVRLYDRFTREPLPGFSATPDAYAMAIRDLDGDGQSEICFVSGTGLFVFSAVGDPLWDVPEAIGGDLAIGQMDDDPALEIATSNGFVVDAQSHLVQWSAGFVFGLKLQAADLDGDGRDELVAAWAWNFVRAWDVDTQIEKWTIPTPINVGAIQIADTNCDGGLEVLIGDGFKVQAVDATSLEQLWEIPNPPTEQDVTWLEFGDVDGDGDDEVVWGAGAFSSAPDHLYFGDPVTETIEWQSEDLQGLFMGPETGDVDGDGEPEVVFGARASNAGYDGPRIIVLDGRTLRRRAISEEQGFFGPISPLLLRNVDADPALEIVMAGGGINDGTIRIYDFAAPDSFTLNWSNAPVSGYYFSSVDAGDADGDGDVEIVAGTVPANTVAEGSYVYVYDYTTKSIEWTSPDLAPAQQIKVQDVAILAGGAAAPDILAILDKGSLYAFDGATHAALPVVAGTFTAMRTAPFAGSRTVYLGDTTGKVYRYQRGAAGYVLAATHNLGLPAIEGITLTPAGILVASEGRLYSYSDLDAAPDWTTLDYGEAFGVHACLGSGIHRRVLAGSSYGVFEVGPAVSIDDVSPTSGAASGGTALAVTGSDFASGAAVYLDEEQAGSVVVAHPEFLSATAPPLSPGSLVSLTILGPDGSRGFLPDAFFADFLDVDPAHAFHADVERMVRRRITAGCGGGNYCPGLPVTRAQMAVFLVRARFGSTFTPPKARGVMFSDVSCGDFAADEIEWLARIGVTAGCGGGSYCGASPVTRAQMAVFLLKTLEDEGYTPPPATGVFDDVPADDLFAPWIEEIASRGISAGCGGGHFCPAAPTTRGQMAAFLARTFFAP